MSVSIGPGSNVPSGPYWSGSESTQVQLRFSGTFGRSDRKISGVLMMPTVMSWDRSSTRVG